MRLFFLTIPKPLKQHPLLKKIIHSAEAQGFRRKIPGAQLFEPKLSVSNNDRNIKINTRRKHTGSLFLNPKL
jgi:hypothetical protein